MADSGAFDVTKTLIGTWDAKWGATGSQRILGGSSEVDPSGVILKKKPIVIPSAGDVVLGRRLIGLDDGSKVRVSCRQVEIATLNILMPWWSSGSIALSPATVNKDEYDYAALLTLHPTDQGAGTTTYDLNFIKAVPNVVWSKRTGPDDVDIIFDFFLYPDRSQLPTKVYGYVGAAP